MKPSLENNNFDHKSSSKTFTFNSNFKKSEYLLFPEGMYRFEIWHNPLNVSALDTGEEQ